MNLFAVSSLSVAVSCVILASFTFFYGRTKSHRLLFLFNLACALWGFGSFLAGIAETEHEAVFGWKIAHLGGVFVSLLFYHLVLVITEIRNRKILYFGYVQAVLFILLIFGTKYIFGTTRYVFDIYYNEAGPLYVFFVIIYLFLVFLSYFQLIKFSKQTKGYKRTKVLYIIFGFLFGFMGGTSTILPEFHIDILYPSGNFGVTLYSFVVSYAILRYRLMDINIVIKKSLVYSFLASLLTGLFVVMVLVLTEYLSDVTDETSFTIAVISALVIAFLFAPLKNRVQSMVDKIFYKTSYDYYASVQKISHDLASTIELGRTCRVIVDTVFETLKLKRTYLLSGRNGYFEALYFKFAEDKSFRSGNAAPGYSPEADGAPRRNMLAEDSELIGLSKSAEIIIREELPRMTDEGRAKTIATEMALFEGEVAVPIFIEKRLRFLLILGEKLSGDIFFNEDINLISTIANQSAIALKNALLYDELERRIVERTAALSHANECLKNEITDRTHAEEALKEAHDKLELRVRERTADLIEANRQLNEEIIERKRVQDELKKTAEEWVTTFDSTKDIILLIDSNNRVIRANKAGTAFFGLECTDKADHPVSELFQSIGMNPDRAPLSNMQQLKKHDESEMYLPEKDAWLLVTVDPILESNDSFTGAVCIIRNITDRKKAEEEKASLEGQLMQVQKMDSIGRLAGGVAHDFNNLLTAIIGYSHLCMMRLPQDSPIREPLKSIRDTGERAAALTHQLLAFSRKQVLEMRSVDLQAVVINIEKILSRLIGEDIEIIIKNPGQVRSIEADPGQIEQVIMNLAVNARDAMPKGGKLIIETANIRMERRTAVSKDDVPSGEYSMVSVTDTGEGMSDDVKEKIFEPFFTTKELGKGTGLGLSTVYGIVKQHKGHITMDSDPGRGTTFNIYFPSAGILKDNVSVTEQEESLLRGDETILLVDDEIMICRVVEDTLQPLGYRVLTASHGTEALQICDAFNGDIDLLLTDVIMPGLNGKELAEKFLQKRLDTKIIFMSGYSGDLVGRHGVLAPGIVFLQKPLNPVVLAHKVREVLDAKKKDIRY